MIGTGQQVDLAAVDLLDPEIHASGPHAIWQHMREAAPLHWQETETGGFWSVTRYDDACRVLGDHTAFTSERGTVITQIGHDDIASGLLMTSCDPPRHTEVRRPLNRRMTARAVGELEAAVERAVVRFFGDVRDGGTWDLAERAMQLPMVVAGELLGIPAKDWDDLVRWTGMAAAPTDPAYEIAGQAATLAVAHHQIFEYFADFVKTRRSRSDEAADLIGHLMTMTAGDDQLTDVEVIYNSYSLLLGANATTPHTVSGTVLALAEHEIQWRAVQSDRQLLAGLVEEGLRFTSAASNFMRHAIEPVDLAGGTVPAGAPVVVWIGSANRDAAQFERPHQFDVTRNPNRHIAFGFGVHYCIGAPLARITLRAVFAELAERFDSIVIDGSPRRLRSIFINGITGLPVRAEARRT